MASKIAALLAIVAVVGVSAQDRPTKEEWENKKAAEKEDVAAKAARQAKMAAVDKVISLLENLQAQVMEEGEKEAATYNKFACFCKDTTAEKTEAIQKGEDEDERLTFSINDLSTQRDGLDTDIDTFQEEIKTAEGEMKEAVRVHEEALALYTKNEADLRGAIDGLNGAIKVMKASKNPSLAQIQSIATTVRTAVVLADVLGLGGAKTQHNVALFLQQKQNPDVEMENYKFHSAGIIETLEQLLKDFTDEKTELDAEEVKRVAGHDAFMQEKTDFVKLKNVELKQAKKDRENKISEIASDSQQLTTVAATLLDDKEYLAELSQMCSDKAKTWDTRIKVRQDELSALTAAIGIIKGGVKENTSAASIRFAQQGVSVRLAEAMAHSDNAMEADEAAAEAADAPAFLQKIASHGTSGPDAGVEAIVSMLRSKGEKFHSTLLTALASKIAADPFAKVKQLIQDLIDRLLTESANESNQKGWCDKATADAEQKREYAAEEIRDLNGQMATLEATRDKLAEELDILHAEIKDLKERRTQADEERTEEKAENEATVLEADAGLGAVNSAIDILDKFYKTAAKSKVDLSLAQGPADDAPDAGFDNGEAYTGASGEAGGILGMLDVIKSDFERTISETEKAEKKAAKEFLEFMTETGKSLAVKTAAEEQKTAQKDDAESKLEEASTSLTSESEILQTSIKELLELKPVCVDTGMSYEERVARREDEIQALNKAMCILKAYAEYGPDGIGDKC